jgi:membrane protein
MRHPIATGSIQRSWLAIPAAVARRFADDNGSLFAAGLSFFMLLSFAPLLLTISAILAFFIQDPIAAAHSVRLLVDSFFPNGGAQDEINHLLMDRLNLNGQVIALVRGRTEAGAIGFVTLIWISLQIFVNAAAAMNAAFEVSETRSWIQLRGIALALMIACGLMLLVTLCLTAPPATVSSIWGAFAAGVRLPAWAIAIVAETLALIVNALLFITLLRYLPNANVRWKSALIGGATTSLLWEVAKKALASWLLRANHTIYGDLANLILFIVWIYYSMTILLIGAEIAAIHQKSVTAAHLSEAEETLDRR